MKWRSALSTPEGAVAMAGVAGAAAIGLALLTGSTVIALLGGLFPIMIAWFLAAGEVRPGHIPEVALVALVLQPFLRPVGMRSAVPAYAVNLLLCLVLAWWMARAGASSRNTALRATRPMLVAMAGVLAALAVSFAVTMSFDVHTVLTLLQFAVLGVFIVMGALAAETYEGAVSACRLLLYAGLLQVPIVLGQTTGLIDRVPVLSQFSSAMWGGAIGAAEGVIRFPGSIGSAELMAEYCGILFLLGIGLSTMVEVGTKRWSTMGVTCVMFLLGWMTSTRGFIVGAVAGVLVFAVFRGTPSGSRGKRLARLSLMALAAAAVVLWVVPRQVSVGFLGRILSTETTGPNVLNRGEMFSAWNTLLGQMPWYGFGGRYLDVLQSAFRMFEIVGPHSLYYTMAFMGGFAALLAMVVLLVMVLLAAIRSMRRGDAHVRALGSVLLVVVSYWMFSQLKIEFIRVMWYGNLVFFIFGVVAGLAGLANRQTVDEPSDGTADEGVGDLRPSLSGAGVHVSTSRSSG
jgi:hypothetical protein